MLFYVRLHPKWTALTYKAERYLFENNYSVDSDFEFAVIYYLISKKLSALGTTKMAKFSFIWQYEYI